MHTNLGAARGVIPSTTAMTIALICDEGRHAGLPYTLMTRWHTLTVPMTTMPAPNVNADIAVIDAANDVGADRRIRPP